MAGAFRKSSISRDAVVFDLLLLALFVVFSVTSFQYNARARSIPLGVGIIGAAMMILQLLVDAVPQIRFRLRFVGERGLLGRVSAPPRLTVVGEKSSGTAEDGGAGTLPAPDPADARWVAVLRLALWLFGFVFLLAWSNYLIAVGLFTVFVTRLEAKVGWVKAVALAAGVDASFFLLFQVILRARL
jgi:hypothetical protein